MIEEFEDETEAEVVPVEMDEASSVKEVEDGGKTETDPLENVRLRAYHLWLGDGEPDGKDQDYWFQAEREIAEEEAPVAPSDPRLVP